MYDTVESTVQFCLQKPNVHNSTLLKNTYEVLVDSGGLVEYTVLIYLKHGGYLEKHSSVSMK